MCGFLQSILVSVPVRVNRWLTSKTADMLWCAHAAPAASMTPRAMETLILEFMAMLLPSAFTCAGRNAQISHNDGHRNPDMVGDTLYERERAQQSDSRRP